MGNGRHGRGVSTARAVVLAALLAACHDVPFDAMVIRGDASPADQATGEGKCATVETFRRRCPPNHWWCTETLMIQGNDLNGVWGSSATDVFAVGDEGTILHHDGVRWVAMTSGTSHDLQAVWGHTPGDVYAAGAAGTVLYYNGYKWTRLALGLTSELADYTYHDIWGTGWNGIYLVGGHGYQHLGGALTWYDGADWRNEFVTTPRLVFHGVWGRGRSDGCAAGTPHYIFR